MGTTRVGSRTGDFLGTQYLLCRKVRLGGGMLGKQEGSERTNASEPPGTWVHPGAAGNPYLARWAGGKGES